MISSLQALNETEIWSQHFYKQFPSQTMLSSSTTPQKLTNFEILAVLKFLLNEDEV